MGEMMEVNGRVLVVGDTHANWPATKSMLNRHLRYPENVFVKHVLQVGDFGYWPRQSGWHNALGEFLAERNVHLHFADGNHEDHEMLDQLHAENGGLDQVAVDEAEHVWHWRRGSVWSFHGFRVMFFGGAASVDRSFRTPGLDWFSEELPRSLDYEYAFSNVELGGQVDFVVAHDTPEFAPPTYDRHQEAQWPAIDIQSSKQVRRELAQLFEVAQPKVWFAGHHHRRESVTARGCQFEVMGCDGQPYDQWAQAFNLYEMKEYEV